MLRLKANKTSMYKLTAEYADLPGMRETMFRKVYRVTDYFLTWEEKDLRCEAHLTVILGKPFLTVRKREMGIFGREAFCEHFSLRTEEMQERGMVEEFITAMERRRKEKAEATV